MKALIITTILVQLFEIGDSCTCVPIHNQRAYCDADYAITAKVVSERITSGYAAYYKIQINETFKGRDKIERVQNISTLSHPCGGDTCIKTRLSSAECGTHLQPGEDYLLIGWIDGDFLSYAFCDSGGNLNHLSNVVVENTRKGYDCSCSVVSCTQEFCYNDVDDVDDDLKCKLNAYGWSNDDKCNCVKSDDKCDWASDEKC